MIQLKTFQATHLSAQNATPPSPSFQQVSSSTPQQGHTPNNYQQTLPTLYSSTSPTHLTVPPPAGPQRNAGSPQPPPKPAHLLTGNAVPKPYQPFSGVRPVDGGATVETHTTIISPINANRVYETSTLENYKLNTSARPPAQSPSFNKATLEACVQDLHQKTFGKTGVVPLSSFKTTTTTSTTGAPASPLNGQGNNFGEYR